MIHDEGGSVVGCLMECPRCDVYTTHAAAPQYGEDRFQCATCFAIFRGNVR